MELLTNVGLEVAFKRAVFVLYLVYVFRWGSVW